MDSERLPDFLLLLVVFLFVLANRFLNFDYENFDLTSFRVLLLVRWTIPSGAKAKQGILDAPQKFASILAYLELLHNNCNSFSTAAEVSDHGL